VKPYFVDSKSNITIYNADWRELDRELLRSDLLLTDAPYGIGEAKGKNKSRNKAFGSKTSLSKNRVIQAKDYGVSDWDDAPPSDFDLITLRDLTKYQIIFGGNYFVLPPSRCWLVWDKLNSGDFADCELAWTNLDKAVRIFRYMWNGMLKENPEYRVHPTQKPRALLSWCLTQVGNDVRSVLDPYAGSCTTAVACKAVGLSCICVEREEKYAEEGAKRLEQEVFQWESI
jgi:DNA modification methylase